MAKSQSVISCPKCGTAINVSNILYHQLETELRQQYERKDARREHEFVKQQQELENQKAALAKQKESLRREVDQAVRSKLKSEKSELEKKLRAELADESSQQLEALQLELRQKSEQLRELNKAKADVTRLEREKLELRSAIEADSEQKLNDRLAQEREKITISEKEKVQTELQKRDKLIDDLNKQLEAAQTKLAQGSNKLSGEVKEIELRNFLRHAYPMDEIRDVPSGISGADVIQTVRNSLGQPSGTILYERKHTQRFDEKWISKLKDDGRTVKADVCIIVTKAMPGDRPETHFHDGVWVATTLDAALISTLLRDSLIRQYSALSSQSDKGTKMEMLYSYLVSNDFRNHIFGILEAFRSMDRSLEKEREEALKKFAEREGHIFKAKQSVLNFAGRIEGIAGESLAQELTLLEESTKELEEKN